MNTTPRPTLLSSKLRTVVAVGALLLTSMPGIRATADAAPACSGIVVEPQAGSVLDHGWSGIAFGSDVGNGNSLGMRVLKRCSDSSQPCTSADDCANLDCAATCDCDTDPTCELRGAAGNLHCLTTLAPCGDNTDCPSGVPCVNLFGPPAPLSKGGTPVCVVSYVSGAATGTFDSSTGDLDLDLDLRRRIYLGISLAQPCPRCGTPAQFPETGDTFTCEGGQFPGAACTVEATTAEFGGTSSDCPPELAANITGAGQFLHLGDLTTGQVTRTAALPCAGIGFTANPLNPGSNPKCTDNLAACASNADCTRCTGDTSVVCASNGDCTGMGVCAEAPDQPVTCGFWCNCGFCDGDASRPCLETADCPMGSTCVAGSGPGTSSSAPQLRPNDCSSDGFTCGGTTTERCATTESGTCSLEPFRSCSDDATCIANSAGTCVFAARGCFEPRITRSGATSPVGSYCAIENAACTTNADCSGAGDSCVTDVARPDLVALSCVPATASSAVNNVGGFTGPAALAMPSLVRVCHCDDPEPACAGVCSPPPVCGNGILEPGETCDGGACCRPDCTAEPGTTVCRAATGVCDHQETCNGFTGDCPADTLLSTATVCRSAAGACDAEETCDGASVDCPADELAPDTAVCRPSIAACDREETCTGTSFDCPADAGVCGTCVTPTLHLTGCSIRVKRGTPGYDADRYRMQCTVDVCDATAGLTPTTDGVSLVLEDSGGICFTDALTGAECVQKSSGFVCRSADRQALGIRSLKLKGRDGCAKKLVVKMADTDLSCLEPAQSPWVPTLASGDDCGSVSCPTGGGDEAVCPGTCGNGTVDTGEECDGASDASCPGACDQLCLCH